MRKILQQLLAALFLQILIFSACRTTGPLLKFHASFPPVAVTRSYSLLDTLPAGSACEFTGIYERLLAGGEDVPVMCVYDTLHGAGYAWLQNPVDVPYGTLLNISGYLVKDALPVKPQKILVNKVNVRNFKVLNANKEYLQKSRRLYKKYLKDMQQFNADNRIALQFPAEPDWHWLCDEKRQTLLSYIIISNTIYESRLEIVYNINNKQAASVTLYSYQKGE